MLLLVLLVAKSPVPNHGQLRVASRAPRVLLLPHGGGGGGGRGDLVRPPLQIRLDQGAGSAEEEAVRVPEADGQSAGCR